MNASRCFVLIVCLLPFCCPVVPALAAQPASQAQAAQGKQVSKKATAKPAHKPVSKAVAKPLPKTKLDLSLPVDMVDKLEPDVGTPSPIQRRKPLLPPMFTEKPETNDSPFQLNGRLINNEMQLQLRNDSRHDVEGAAIDFEYRQ
ncbi:MULTISPECIES: hypothetical protein [Pseudomonas]|jgi:hypothetical protein|uniref:Translation initiation factor 2 n=1 Tax=Pseudomonas putida S12 TaxID=1215087 RepID=A0AA34RR61_PSEPU|nr:MULTISPECIES: hypothetical protein [Pseudomonas]HBK49984.1 hypothetical protein [Pseudomonas sp.]AJA11984.1 hypothetical protein RPPX_01105 [Pseudomonas putida S12]AOX08382.1 hypothetical protein Q5O_08285 [Pseudomonas putida JB]MCI1023838.1 hypothetical protein [Pseudomonas putida]MDN4513230.1 hypothetical protein [Pseudomonas sp. 2,4-D]